MTDAADLCMPLPPFTRDGYRDLIGRFLAADYRPASFAGFRRERRDLVLRHDVDVSLEAAVRLAELEREMGVQAAYFVMVSSDFYNIFSADGRRLLGRLAELGHAVGLHFDPAAHPSSADDVTTKRGAAIAREFRLLKAVVAHPIELISLHNPSRELVDRERPPGWMPHTYEPRYFSDIAYISESGGEWRYGSPFERPAFRDGTAIHLLIHPIWWAEDEPPPRPELVLERFAKGQHRHIQLALAKGFRAYREFLHTGDKDDFG